VEGVRPAASREGIDPWCGFSQQSAETSGSIAPLIHSQPVTQLEDEYSTWEKTRAIGPDPGHHPTDALELPALR